MTYTEQVKQAHSEFKTLFQRLYEAFTECDGPMKSLAIPDSQLCDMGFFWREIAHLADELRKEAKARSELAGRLLCLSRLKDGDGEFTTHGEYATGSSDGGLIPVVPNPGSPEYEQLCQLLGVADSYGGLIRFHWKTLKGLMETAAAEGKDFPVRIKTTPEFKTTFRRRSNGTTN